MQLFNPDFGLYFIVLLIIILISFVTGGILSRFVYVSESKYFRVFFNLLIGYLFWICLTAFYFTKGNSILVILPVSLITWRLIFGERLKMNKYGFSTVLKDAVILLKEGWLLVFIFILFSIEHILSNGNIEHDYLYYSNVAYALKQSGIEGMNFGMFASYITHPYHYSDIWLTSFITEIFNTNYYHTIVFISIPFLLFIVYSGTIALIMSIGARFYNQENLKYVYVYACCIFLLGGLDYPLLREYMAGTIGLIQQPKTSIIYMIYILALIFLLENKIKYSFFVILLLPILYTQTAFFVLPAVGILILVYLNKDYREGIKYLGYYSVIVLTTMGFYYINSKFSNEGSMISFNADKLLEGLHSFPLQFIKKTIRFSIVYFPFLLLFFYKKDNFYSLFNRLKKSLIFVIIIIFLLSGYFFSFLFSSAFSMVNQDYAQMLYNGFLPLVAVYCFVILMGTAYEISSKKTCRDLYLKVILLLIITGGTILQQHRDPRYWGHIEIMDVDEEFYTKLSETLNDNDKIASYQNFEPPGDLDWFQYNYQLYPNLSRIANFKNKGVYFPECINVNEMDTTKSDHRKYYYNKSPFIHFLDSSKISNPEITPGEAQFLFLKKYKFDYVIVPDSHKIPFEVQTLISDSINRNDGFRIYKLLSEF